MGTVGVVLAVVSGLVLCLGLIYGLARGDAVLRGRALRKRAQRELQERSGAAILARIDEQIAALEREIEKVRASAGAYSAVGSAPGSVIALHAEIEELEAYRGVVAALSAERAG